MRAGPICGGCSACKNSPNCISTGNFLAVVLIRDLLEMPSDQDNKLTDGEVSQFGLNNLASGFSLNHPTNFRDRSSLL